MPRTTEETEAVERALGATTSADAEDVATDVPTSWLAAMVGVFLAGAAWGIARPLWLDEAFSLAVLEDPWRSVVADRGSMVGYHALLWPIRQLHDAPWLLRLPSVAAIAIAIVLVARLVARDHGRPAAVATGLLIAVGWPFVSHGQEVRSYALGLLVTVVQWLVLRRHLERGSRSALWWWAVLCIGSTAVHGLAILQVLGQAAAVELAGFDRATRRTTRTVLVVAAIAPAILALTGAASLTAYLPGVTPSTLVQVLELPIAPDLLGLPAIALAAMGAARLVGRARATGDPLVRFVAVTPLAWAVVPPAALIAVSLVTPKMVPRYVFPSAVGAVVLVGVGLAALPTRRHLVAATAVLLALAVSYQVAGHQAGTGDWTEAVRLVATESRPDDAIVFPRANRRTPFDAEWARLDDPPQRTAVNPDRPLGQVRWLDDDLPIAEVVADAGRHDRVWLVTEPFASLDREQPVADGLDELGFEQVQTWDLGMSVLVYLYERP